MRQITKDTQIIVDGSSLNFRLAKMDAFSGVMLLRLLMRLENTNDHPSLLEGIAWSLSGFFRRRAVGTGNRPCGYVPLTCPNVDEFLFLPVAAGMWKQHELWDGTYTLDDLLDAVELIRVRRENEARAADAVRA